MRGGESGRARRDLCLGLGRADDGLGLPRKGLANALPALRSTIVLSLADPGLCCDMDGRLGWASTSLVREVLKSARATIARSVRRVPLSVLNFLWERLSSRSTRHLARDSASARFSSNCSRRARRSASCLVSMARRCAARSPARHCWPLAAIDSSSSVTDPSARRTSRSSRSTPPVGAVATCRGLLPAAADWLPAPTRFVFRCTRRHRPLCGALARAGRSGSTPCAPEAGRTGCASASRAVLSVSSSVSVRCLADKLVGLAAGFWGGGGAGRVAMSANCWQVGHETTRQGSRACC